MNCLTMLFKHLTLFWCLRNGTKISDAKSLRCYLELFPGGGIYENTRENQVGGICFRTLTVSRAWDERNYDYSFSLRKRNGPRRPEMFYITFDCSQLNQTRTRTLAVLPGPDPDPNIICAPRPGPEHYLCCQARTRTLPVLPGPDRADLYRVLVNFCFEVQRQTTRSLSKEPVSRQISHSI
jgi:hypothetical protein